MQEFDRDQHDQPARARFSTLGKVWTNGGRPGSDARHAQVLSHFKSERLTRRESYFLLHRTPSFVFSITMPAATSSARKASETLKLRALRAASISAIFFSMSASES